MKLYEKQWFINFINNLRKKSPWFERWGWGYSVNMEDLVRNPFEEFSDHFFPFCIRNVKAYSLLLRCGYIPYKPGWERLYILDIKKRFPLLMLLPTAGTYRAHRSGKSFGMSIGRYRIFDIIASEWVTKYPNALLMFQISICLKWFIPIPCISFGLRFKKTKYLQIGFGWGPQWHNYLGRYPGDTSMNARFGAKLRIGDYLGELSWNPGSEVFGFWEGNV